MNAETKFEMKVNEQITWEWKMKNGRKFSFSLNQQIYSYLCFIFTLFLHTNFKKNRLIQTYQKLI